MAKRLANTFFWMTSSIPIVLGVLLCHLSILFEEPDTIPDRNRHFFDGSLNKAFFFSKKDEHLDKVLKATGPPSCLAHVMNVHQGHLTDEMIMLAENNSEYILVRRFPVAEKIVKFRIGVEFEEVSLSQENLKSIVIQDIDKLIHIQRRPYNRPTVVTTRWFTPDRLVVVIEIPRKNLTTRMVYRPAKHEDSRFDEVTID